MSLRAELIGSMANGDPDFAVLLPPGWEATSPEFTSPRDRVSAAVATLPLHAQGAARARMAELLDTARAEAERADVIRIFAPTASSEKDVVPVSLVAAWLNAPVGSTAAQLGSELIERHGASPLDPTGAILTWRIDTTAQIESSTVRISGAGYLLRAPGLTHKALLFRSTIFGGLDSTKISDEGVAAMGRLCDAIVASVRWRKRA
ncbi:MAG: hypothetical protein K0S70_4754 [Microbacterium sp.]|jgi:hypothetical protein|nr:hypothetical protein [Microbacterium sp.]